LGRFTAIREGDSQNFYLEVSCYEPDKAPEDYSQHESLVQAAKVAAAADPQNSISIPELDQDTEENRTLFAQACKAFHEAQVKLHLLYPWQQKCWQQLSSDARPEGISHAQSLEKLKDSFHNATMFDQRPASPFKRPDCRDPIMLARDHEMPPGMMGLA
jgi:hypothetical protein